jgi:uncharacterized protein (DUF1800 family)
MPELCRSKRGQLPLVVVLGLGGVLLAACGGGGGGSSSSSATPAPIASSVVPISVADATRLADQAAFGPTPTLVTEINQQGSAWIDAQLTTPASGYPAMGAVNNNSGITCPVNGPNPQCFRDNYSAFPIQRAFFQNAVSGRDQLRQRVAFAYSQIFVVSSAMIEPGYALREYHQMLLNDSFVNYRQLIEDVTLSPVMGAYLNMANNNKGNAAAGVSPNENYAREVLQLFSIGLNELNPDGTLVLQGGFPVPTYTQDTIEGFANTFTGWTYPTAPGATAKSNNPAYYIGQMSAIQKNHDTTTKLLLNGTRLAANQSAQSDLKGALDTIYNHPNVGPFIGRQLIQFLVTSNPSPAYVGRVSAVFNNDGAGVRGNMAAVIKAILMDSEARGDVKTDPHYGKLREPVVDFVSVLRATGGRTDGDFPINMTAGEGQPLFGPNTVFSFYSPSYPLPGSATLVAPQFGILNTASVIARLNFLNALLYTKGGIAPDQNLIGATGTQIDLSDFDNVVGDAGSLIALLDARLLHNTLTAAESSNIATAVNMFAATDRIDRATTALYLVLASPHYQIVR